MTTPLISIILPTRNRLETIRHTVDRVQSQSFTDWELVISDNASEDEGKVEYLRELAASEPRVRLYEQESNIGIHKNWRFCIERTGGRYYIAVTDDDWWGEDDYLEKLLFEHDGKTGSVFPNMCVHRLDTGEIKDRVLTEAYGGSKSRYEMYEALVRDGKGAVMIGLIDTEVVPKAEIIEAIDNDRVFRIEAIGMHRLARKYPIKFKEEMTYHHPEYTGNYSKAFDQARRAQDAGIVYFQLLDEIRQAAREDGGFSGALELHWSEHVRNCLQILKDDPQYLNFMERLSLNREKIKELENEIDSLKGGELTLKGVIRSWWRRRRDRGSRESNR